MVKAFESIFYIYLSLCAVSFIVYLPRLSFFFFALRKQKRLFNAEKNRFAVIVPAREESLIISACLDKLAAQDYDAKLYDIHVVVARADDPTVKIAAGYKNTFVHVVGEQTCKGDALDGAIKNILRRDEKDKPNAFIIIDADNFAAPNFLTEMNNALGSGAAVVVGKKRVQNWTGVRHGRRTWVTNCASLLYAGIDDMGNKARTALKMPVNVFGNGLMVRADVIAHAEGWPYKTLTEDYEVTADAIARDIPMRYYEHAVVETQEVMRLGESNKRRVRWMRGFAQCSKKYRKAIRRSTFTRRGIKFRNLDYLYGYMPLVLFAAAGTAMSLFGVGATIAAGVTGEMPWYEPFLLYTILPVGGTYLLLFLYTAMQMLIMGRSMSVSFLEKLVTLFINPLYLMGWVPIFFMAFTTRRKNVWEHVERTPVADRKE